MRRRIVPGLVRLGRRIHAWVFRPDVDTEVDEEIAFHVEMRTRQLVEAGMDPAAARAEAERRLGDVEGLRDRMRRIGRRREGRMTRRAWWSDVRRDVRYAVRTLWRSPGFAGAVVATLALGIGANAAVFSVVDGVLLRPLPYERPDELVALWTKYLPESGYDIPVFPLSYEEALDYAEQSRTLAGVAPYYTSRRPLTDDRDAPVRAVVGVASADLFPLLGARAELGRTFRPEEDVPDGPAVAVLSHRFWRDRFGADPGILGQTLTLNGEETRVLGVMPPEFRFPTASTDLWIPLGLDPADPGNRASHFIAAVGRLAPGATLAEAEAERRTITARWYDDFEHHSMGHFVTLTPLHEDLTGDSERVLWLLLAATGLVLLVACANVANLLLARGERRAAEVAVRMSLGASRGRLVRQLFTESAVLAGIGAALGLLLAHWGTRALLAIDPTVLPLLDRVGVDLRVLGFTVAVALATAAVFGLAPLAQLGDRRGAALPGAEGRSTGGTRGQRRFRRGLVAAEVALSLVVVVAAGLLVRSFRSLSRIDPGFRAENLLTFDLQLNGQAYPEPAEVVDFYRRLLEDVRGLPGVTAASAVSTLPLTGTGPRADFEAEGLPEPAEGEVSWNAEILVVHPGYFETLGIALRSGRTLEPSDGLEGAPVAVVNATMAEQFWPEEDPVGRRFRYGSADGDLEWITIVGVTADAKTAAMDEPALPQVYLPHAQLRRSQGSTGYSFTVVARTAGEAAALTGPARAAVARLDPGLPVSNVRTMEDVVGASLARPRLTANLLGAFGLLALVLAAVGIFGVVSYSVARRTREIGVRMALGARRGVVVRMVVREGVAPALLGIAVGVAAALAGSRLLADLLFGVEPTDPLTFAALPAVLLGVAALASWLPARRAVRIDPVEALRDS